MFTNSFLCILIYFAFSLDARAEYHLKTKQSKTSDSKTPEATEIFLWSEQHTAMLDQLNLRH